MRNLVLLLCLLGFNYAHALVEARLTYGVLGSKPDLATIYSGTTTLPTVAPNAGIGFDALFIFPLVKIGIGARYENLGFNVSSEGLEFKSQLTRTSLILNYRLIDTVMYLGPIATIGMSHTNNIKWTEGSSATDFTPDTTSSYSVGLEAGVALLGFRVGAEAGYQNMKWNKVKDSTGTSSSTPDLDMSGSYVKAVLGFGI
tara:strand:+ start:66118 stop:66717 length:600 start_codon:yes stop_codon:yes gene_type:complete